MNKLRMAAVLMGATTLALASASPALASPAKAPSLTCSGGDIASGTYSKVTVTGPCSVPDGATVTVLGNLTVAPGAMFDAQTHSTVTVDGNVLAGAGSLFGLGCTPAHPCNGDESEESSTSDYVAGNLILDHVFDAALNGNTIGGNVVVDGGGPGYSLDPWIPFSIKDNHIKGNLVVDGLQTSWFGVIRTVVDGNVILKNIQGADPDANEVVADSIGGNLICSGNTPAPHLGDAVEGAPPGYGATSVGGKSLGQCAEIPS